MKTDFLRPYHLPLACVFTLFSQTASAGEFNAVAGASIGEAPVAGSESSYLESVRAAIPPPGLLSYEWHDSHDMQDQPGSAEWQVFEVRSPIFVNRLDSGATIEVGFDASLVDLDVSAGADSWSGQIYGVFMPVSMIFRTPESDWTWISQIAPGLRTDFENISSDDFAIRAFAVAMRQINPNLSVGFGGYISYDVDGIFAVPGIGVTWIPAEDWLLSLIPPELALSWRPDPEWIFSASLRPRSFLADINADAGGPDFVKVRYGKLALAAKRRISGQEGGLEWWLGVNGGYTVYSEVELERSGQSLVDGDLDQGAFGGLSLELRGW